MKLDIGFLIYDSSKFCGEKNRGKSRQEFCANFPCRDFFSASNDVLIWSGLELLGATSKAVVYVFFSTVKEPGLV